MELKEKSVELQESLKNAEDNDCVNLADKHANIECTPLHVTNPSENQSKWLQLLGTGLVVAPHHLQNAETGAEFACVHNHDSSDFTNKKKFMRYILRKTKSTEPYEWDNLTYCRG